MTDSSRRFAVVGLLALALGAAGVGGWLVGVNSAPPCPAAAGVKSHSRDVLRRWLAGDVRHCLTPQEQREGAAAVEQDGAP